MFLLGIFGAYPRERSLGRAGHDFCSNCERERDFDLVLAYHVPHVFFVPFEFIRLGGGYFLRCRRCAHGRRLAEHEALTLLDQEQP